MDSVEFWPYLLILPALVLGTLLAHLWHVWRQRALRGQTDRTHALASKRHELRTGEAELVSIESRLMILNQQIAAARRNLEEQEAEYKRILLSLDEHHASLQNAHRALRNVQQNLSNERSRTDTILTDIDASIEELDMLTQLSETYNTKIARLTQQVQWQDGELQMLRQAVKAKTSEIDEARALIEQRETELRRLIRQRQQREADIARVRQQIIQRNEELRRLLEFQEQGGQTLETSPAFLARSSQIDVTPPPRPMLLSGNAIDMGGKAGPLDPQDDISDDTVALGPS